VTDAVTHPETWQRETAPSPPPPPCPGQDEAGPDEAGPGRTLRGLAEQARVRLGAAVDTPPDLLCELARDPAVMVRAAVAMNVAAPGPVDQLLAADRDERVRTPLSRKLASLIPNITMAQRNEMEGQALRTLATLVEDEAVRVRAAIADVVKEMPSAPRDLILRLARDSALTVSEPVIRLSPLLSAEDLLALLAEPPSPGVAAAVASRPGLPVPVADAIAAGANGRLIAILIANRSAAIREATLDMLIARASAQLDWHDPLVRRPALSARAARALSEIVTTHLLAVLATRADLDPEVTRELRRRLASRRPPTPQAQADPTLAQAIARAEALLAQDRLDEATLLAAAQRGEARLCTAMLALAADVPPAVVDRAVTLRSAKGIVSLTWKAGLSMRVAGPLQVLLCRVGPIGVLRADAGNCFPLAIEEMRWHLELLQRMRR
jgi:uncharacterized protein (DUF2336 family)